MSVEGAKKKSGFAGELPSGLAKALAPLFEKLPLEAAMPELCPSGPAPESQMVQGLIQGLVPELEAGLWLYVDELERSHLVSQSLDGPVGAFWHAIMHRREGDFSNSKYWYRQVGEHPAMAEIPGYEPYEFVDQVSESYRANPDELVERQREEWAALFSWCARQTERG
jgi:hypothetical protein